jgi:hypothetical protein
MAEGKTPGNGKTSPFGNGKGAPESGAAGRPTDFTKSPTSQYSGGKGASNFVRNPNGSGQDRPTVNDYAKNPTASGTPSQRDAKPEVVPNPQEVPPGGKTLFADPAPGSDKRLGSSTDQGRKPFKVGK